MIDFRFVHRASTILTAVLSICSAAEPGTIRGTINIPGGVLNDTKVWALTSDCRRSYGTTTDAKGKFEVRGVPPGNYGLLVGDRAFFQRHLKEVIVESGSTAEGTADMEIYGAEGRESPFPLNGRIVNSAGRPVEGAIVVFQSWYTFREVSDADGRFGFCEVGDAKAVMTVKSGAYRTRRIRVNPKETKYRDGKLEIRLRAVPRPRGAHKPSGNHEKLAMNCMPRPERETT